MLPRNHPDGIHIAFDDRRLVANAGLILPSTLALRLGLPQLGQKHLDLGYVLGRANTGGNCRPTGSAFPPAACAGGVPGAWAYAFAADCSARR